MSSNRDKSEADEDVKESSKPDIDIPDEELKEIIESIDLSSIEEMDPNEPTYTLSAKVEWVEVLGPYGVAGDSLSEALDTVPDYGQFLTRLEGVSGDMHRIHVSFVNEGDQTFPGGAVTELKVKSSQGSTRYNIDVDVPEIDPNESTTVALKIPLLKSGQLTHRIRIQSKDDMIVDIKGMGEDPEVFAFTVRVVDREQLLILNNLRSIRRKLSDG